MKKLSVKKSTLVLLVAIPPIIALFVYVSLRSGPLAPIPLTVATVENRSIAPALFGIGTIEAQYTYKIGPTITGRVKRLAVHVGDQVRAGQILGEMDSVDISERIRSQEAAIKRSEAQLREAEERQAYAQTQARRYAKLLAVNTISQEIAANKKHELQIAETGLNSARGELARVRSDREALDAQRNNLYLIAPVDGLVTQRSADPGTTVVPGQTVIELIDSKHLWVNVRFDQISSHGLQPDLPAQIVLRSHNGQALSGRVLRVEPLADVITEEILAKVLFDQLPEPLPPVGELAEVTIALSTLPSTPVILNAAVHRVDGRLGVWQIVNGELFFTPVSLGISDLDGNVQILTGLKAGDQAVVYSAKALNSHSRFRVVDSILETTP
ncbi:MAG: efflux RND transporter periplasmic adaptor subunit [Proteobacteria bacterium]|nr:efflux RND transporter periplasmic adaptor subunit [Pseudomonadota bacterium]MBU1542413.1 efflux RND transporter periplasmic adaptor subunit [Pseudomonadota bacterium]MBU2430032.1 efflux RND transporter periplasmic adaptor subunit [Pseudomonadota bacterium]MBU2482789.1 efflux RND transporter periplasmic adaptor subunit [Pseudomonadota bacterium]